ncbi:MAG TPA: hypothetical protein VNI57_04485, partial [Candidatus Saccharimonadales bacterium]|nr:hypothetical protein [Candidatus Saccharimonadales bacterium]
MSKQRSKTRRDPQREKLDKGRSLLAAWGFHDFTLPAATPGPAALEKLDPLIGRDPACDLVIAGWLGRFPDAAVAARLAAWEKATSDKELRREIRRSLFKLEQKGIAVERNEAPRPAFSLGGEVAEPRGYLGAVDGDGSRMAWLLHGDRGHLTGIFTVINDQDGMVYVDAVSGRRHDIMERIRDAISKSGPLVEVPWRYADALMCAAFRKASPRPGNMKADFLLNRGEITKEDAAPVPPCPIVEEIPEASTADASLLETSAELFREREFATWVLPSEIAHRRLKEYSDSTSSGLVLSKEAATERVLGIMDAGLQEFLDGPLRPLYVRRLEEMAWILDLRDRKEAARKALAVARA